MSAVSSIHREDRQITYSERNGEQGSTECWHDTHKLLKWLEWHIEIKVEFHVANVLQIYEGSHNQY